MQNAADVLQAILSGKGISLPDVSGPGQNDDASQFENCERHGKYRISMRDDQGVVRYRPAVCPACLAERKSQQMMQSAAISRRHQNCSFETFVAQSPEQKAVFDVCLEYAQTFAKRAFLTGACMILSGNPGTGKNHLATAIARMVMDSGFSVMQTTAHEVIMRIRETWGKTSVASEREVVRIFGQADLLILDEVGKQFGGKGDEVHLFEVVNQRYLEMKPTIVLSNETKEGIEDYLGTAAFDRLCENGVLLQMNWPGYRRGRG